MLKQDNIATLFFILRFRWACFILEGHFRFRKGIWSWKHINRSWKNLTRCDRKVKSKFENERFWSKNYQPFKIRSNLLPWNIPKVENRWNYFNNYFPSISLTESTSVDVFSSHKLFNSLKNKSKNAILYISRF